MEPSDLTIGTMGDAQGDWEGTMIPALSSRCKSSLTPAAYSQVLSMGENGQVNADQWQWCV